MPTASIVAPAAPAVPALSERLVEPSADAEPSVATVTVGRKGVRYLAHQCLTDLYYAYQTLMPRDE
eukprot:1975220-Lingulodinium_polyedra.AAC.1